MSKATERICPFMSGQIVPIGVAGGIQSANQVQAAPALVNCAGEKCPLFYRQADTCSLFFLGELYRELRRLQERLESIETLLERMCQEIADGFLPLQPPDHSPSPIARIATAVESLIETRSKAKGKG